MSCEGYRERGISQVREAAGILCWSSSRLRQEGTLPAQHLHLYHISLTFVTHLYSICDKTLTFGATFVHTLYIFPRALLLFCLIKHASQTDVNSFTYHLQFYYMSLISLTIAVQASHTLF